MGMRVARSAALLAVICLLVAPIVTFAACPVFHSCCPRHQPVKDCSVSCVDLSSHQAIAKASIQVDGASVTADVPLSMCDSPGCVPPVAAQLLPDEDRYLRIRVIRC